MAPAAAEFPNDLDSRRFLFVTGKGGVGKTTVAAALALALASRGKRVLIAMCGAHERLSSIMGTPPIGHEMSRVSDGIWASKIEPELAMEEYGQLVIRVRAITRAVFDHQYTKALFRAIPGLFEWAMLGKAWFHTTEKGEDGTHRFDVVIFDAPSTGHGLDMLRVPKVILAVAPPGVLRRDAERAWSMFQDPAQSGVVVVSWPEEMPTTETIELVEALQNELALPIAKLVVNGVLTPLFGGAEREQLLADGSLLELGTKPAAGQRPGDVALGAAARRAAREGLQEQALDRLRTAIGLPMTVLPFLLEGAGSPEGARQLAALL